ncbi:MAG TPA: hypothetical protein DIU44_06115, partial [Acholeplasmatales bacterium]|nr:hypothetical protein [Acholeplasmatales bacterium]
DEKECEKRIKNALEAVGLYKFRKKLAGALSGGQMQRVSIARALVKHNDVIIADEPTGNLDSESTRQIIRILKKLSINSLIILVTHDISLANTYADYIYHIKDGKISHYKENNLKDNEKEDNFTYDDSFYEPIIKKDRAKFGLLLKEEFCNFFNDKVKGKIFKFAFFLIGIIFMVINVLVTTNNPNKINDIAARNDVYTLKISSFQTKENIYSELARVYDLGYIDDIYSNNQSGSLKIKMGVSTSIKLDYSNVYNQTLIKDSLIIGKRPENTNEVVITSKMADELTKSKYYRSYDEIIGLKLFLNESIVGIAKNDQAYIYKLNQTYNSANYYYNSGIYNFEIYDDSLQIEGNKPKSLNDIVVSSQFLINKGLKVGQTLNNGDKICGSFDNRKEIVYGLSDRIFIQSIESEEVDCTINDLTRLKGYQTFEVTNKYENIYENNLDNYNQSKYINLTIEIILIIICAIYLIFTMKSKMLHDIYEIGVRRELGQKRISIILNYILKSFVTLTLTIIIGYILSTLIYIFIALRVNSFGGNIPVLYNSLSTYLIILIIYVMGIMFGIIPVLLLLKHTPAEIVKKYDI